MKDSEKPDSFSYTNNTKMKTYKLMPKNEPNRVTYT